MKNSLSVFLLGTLFSVSSGAAFAIDCYEESRNFVSLGEAYFDVGDPVRFSSSEKKQLRDLYKSIKGEWEGESVFTDCRGSSKAMKAYSKTYEMETEVEKGREETIRFQTDKRDGNKTTMDVAYYFDDETIFHYQRSGSTITVEEKYYQPNGSGAHLVENLISFDARGKKMSIDITSYFNGHFSSHQTISLVKK